MKATVSWSKGLLFTGRADSGHSIVMDGPERAGGSDSAPRPSELLLLSLAGCTAMDVISILGKKRQSVSSLQVSVSGDQADEHPAAFRSLKVTYTVTGENIDPAAVRRAIELSEKKYCSVGATLKQPVEIATDFEIVPE
jgi:putative redox protein